MTGDTAATISGSLTVDPALATDANGATLIEASSIQDALERSIVGTVTVQHAGETLTYSMGVGESGINAAAHKSFRVGAGAIELEDMTRSVNGSDFDYNDHFWSTNVSEVSSNPPSLTPPPSPPPPTSPPPPGGPTFVWITNGAGTTETGPANGWLMVNRSNTLGALTVNFAVDTSGNMPMATLNLDYEIVGNGTSVTFAAGMSQVPIYIHPLIDTLVEPIEIVKLALAAGSNYMVYTPNNAFIELGDVKLIFDLDVNANNVLTDVGIDKAENYLPGYKQNVAMLTTPAAVNASFNDSVFAPQRMKLVLDNIGTDTLDVTAVVFEIVTVTSYFGYVSNRSDARIEEPYKAEDYSFRVDGDQPYDLHVVNRDSSEEQAFGGAFSGKMEANKTWVNFYCKDYGGAAMLRATIFVKDGATDKPQASILLKIPKDVDGDNLADKWELEMGTRWRTQYGIPVGAAGWATEAEILAKFQPEMDDERPDPDLAGTTAAGPLVAQAEAGDAHTMFEEYRGYILDGGGLNGNGGGGHPGGHIRLDPARKEILVEVDRAAVVNNLPAGGITAVMTGASGVFSNNTRGAGIYMYWLMDEVALDLPKEKVDTPQKLATAWRTSRDTVVDRKDDFANLRTDFLHMLFVDDIGVVLNDLLGGAASTNNTVRDLLERGSVLAVTNLKNNQAGWGLNAAKFDELLMTAVAHEITHLLFQRTDGPFNGGEHTIDPNENGIVINDVEDKTCLMYQGTPTRGRSELATAKFFKVLQKELKVKSNEALVLD